MIVWLCPVLSPDGTGHHGFWSVGTDHHPVLCSVGIDDTALQWITL